MANYSYPDYPYFGNLPSNIVSPGWDWNQWKTFTPEQQQAAVAYNQQLMPWTQMAQNASQYGQDYAENVRRWNEQWPWQRELEGRQMGLQEQGQNWNQWWAPEQLARQQQWQTAADLAARQWQTGERQGTQGWQTGERLGTQGWQSGESAAQRAWQQAQNQAAQGWQTGERLGQQQWQGAQNLAQQQWGTGERVGQQQWGTGERLGTQQYQTGENLAARGWQTGERLGTQTWQEAQNEQNRALARQQMATEAENASLAAFGRRMRPNTRYI